MVPRSRDLFIQIAVNGQHFADWKHKLPLSKAKVFQIRGNVKIATVTFEEDFIVESSAPIGKKDQKSESEKA